MADNDNNEDLREDPEFKVWANHVRENVIPKMVSSALTISLAPKGDPDVKYAVELGLSIMLNKPIFIVCYPGQELPLKLMQVADKIIEIDWQQDPTGAQQAIADGIQDWLKENGL